MTNETNRSAAEAQVSETANGGPIEASMMMGSEGLDFELQLLKQAIDRTEAIVREESTSLKRGEIIDLQEFSSRKSHQLLALNRAFEAVSDPAQREQMTKELGALRAALDENAGLLQTRLGAVQEVADIIASIMLDAESDGTYSRSMRGGGRQS